MSPGQLLKRLGFTNAQLSTPVRDLSGGQRRRLQLLLVLLDEPNVLVLDEPTNDMDTDMLAAMEDLLDSWPGTLLVVSHDRYLLERVTDQQYALLEGRLWHVPGGVDEYLRLLAAGAGGAGGARAVAAADDDAAHPSAGADARGARKELAALERRLTKASARVATLHEQMAAHDPSDYAGLAGLHADVVAAQAEVTELETRWLHLAEQLG